MSGFTGMPKVVFEERVKRMCGVIEARELDGAFIFSDEYRPGFTTYFSDYKPINIIEESPQGVFITPKGEVALFLGAINAQAAKRVSWIQDIRPIDTLSDYFDERKKQKGDKLRIGLSGQDLLPVKYFTRLQALLVNNTYIDIDADLTAMRQVKVPEEIALLAESARIGDAALKACIERMAKEEVTEIDLCATAEYTLKSLGADLSCATVLSSGMNTESPTWRPTHRKIQDGEAVLIDVAPAYKGYASDVALTVFKGKADEDQKRILRASHDIVTGAMETLKPGEPASRIYDVFLEGAKKNRVEQYFLPYAKGLRAVGHSIGLDCVERPNLDVDSAFLLTPGMTLALKFDLHGLSWGGVRIEAVMLVEEKRCSSLNRLLYEM